VGPGHRAAFERQVRHQALGAQRQLVNAIMDLYREPAE
jgi:hypothetical protein